mmetsp:Transcript_10504/g.29765  ORF Transcript_10504/g.29765 Transcript_10504/m.29765 type:complete len:82 (+) Transcript_10504:151-396(+)
MQSHLEGAGLKLGVGLLFESLSAVGGGLGGRGMVGIAVGQMRANFSVVSNPFASLFQWAFDLDSLKDTPSQRVTVFEASKK